MGGSRLFRDFMWRQENYFVYHLVRWIWSDFKIEAKIFPSKFLSFFFFFFCHMCMCEKNLHLDNLVE